MQSTVAENRIIKTVPTARPAETVAEAEAMLLKRTKEFETINYIYILDKEDKLVGVISVKEIFRASKSATIQTLMETKIISAHPHTHQEKVANLALRHNLKAIPVVDKENNFLGVVPSDVILQILHEEHGEDVMRSAGIIISGNKEEKNIISAAPVVYLKKRMPWLMVGLGGGVAAAFLIGGFENALKEMLTLAAFTPALVYIADAVGSQTQTIFIRSLAIDHSMGIRKYILREIMVGIMIALILSLSIMAIAYAWWEPPILGLILGLSFFTTILTAIAVALFLPWLFLRIKIDPAIASGPFATIIRDVLSLIIYFNVASLLI